MTRLQVSLSKSLDRVKYVGPLREAPQRINVEVSTGSQELGSKGERALRLLSRDPDLLIRLNAAFADMEIPYEANISTLRADDDSHSLGDVNVLTLRELKTGLVTTLSDVGFGVSQVVPVLLQLLINEQSIILIEQPELHLHPKLQARLADVIATSIQLRRNRVLIETHSEHLLTRLQRRCREKEFLTPQMLNIIYVDARDEQNPLSHIRLGDDGEMIDPWPAGFFDDQLSDLFGGVEELALLPEG